MGEIVFIFDTAPVCIPFVFIDTIHLELQAESEHTEGVMEL